MCMVCARHTIGLEIVWMHLMAPLVTRLKWKHILVLLEIVLILAQDRCTVHVECTIGSEIVLDTPDDTTSNEAQVGTRFGPFGDSANLDAILEHGLR